MADEVLKEISSDIRRAPFFSIILDTIQDIAKIDELNEVRGQAVRRAACTMS